MDTLVSVVIPNYNGKHLLDDCLGSLLSQTHPKVEIVVVDNASSDGSVEYVRDTYPTVRTLRNRENLGFGAAVNQGIRATSGELVFVLNNDTEVDAHCIESLVEVAQTDPTVGMCATKILDFRRRNVIDVAGIVIYPDCSSRGRGRLEVDVGQYSKVEEVFGPSGAAGLYRRSMLDDVGLFDADYFMYCEDTDLAFRARLAGWRCLFVPDAVVYHLYSATSGSYSPAKAYLVERNRLWTAVKVLPWPDLVSSLVFTAIRYAFQAAGAVTGKGAAGQFACQHSRLELVVILTQAYWSGLLGLGRAIRKRFDAGARRRVKPRTIRRWFHTFGIGARELCFTD